MMVPVPALLAMMVLLLWPAARLTAVLLQAPDRRRGESARLDGVRSGAEPYLVAALALAANFLVFILSLGAIAIAAAVMRRLASDDLLLFGVVSLKSMFEFIMLLQFAVFVVQSALDSRRRVRAYHGRLPAAEWGKFLPRIRDVLRAEAPIYASAAIFSAAIFLLGAGLFSRFVTGVPI